MYSRFLSLAGVSFGFITDLFSSVDRDLGPGWHGLVGPNGAGKATLLSIMSGELSPRDGTVSRSGPVVDAARSSRALVVITHDVRFGEAVTSREYHLG